MRKIILFFCLFVVLCQAVVSADYFTMGKNAFAQQDYELADKYFVSALTQDPNNADCRYYYAQTLAYLQKYAQAKREYTFVINLAPKSLAAEYSRQALAYIEEMEQKETTVSKPNATSSESNSDNYIYKALSADGNIVVWDKSKMPLKVYIDNSYRAKAPQVEAVKEALATWASASGDLVKYMFINEPKYADITIVFKGLAKKMKNLTLGVTKNATENSYITSSEVTFYTLEHNYRQLTAVDLYNIALHEFGHVLGISGHSDNKLDIMYALYDTKNQKTRMALSQNDINTVKALYEIDKNPYSNSENSINKILGSKEERLNQKLQNALDYLKEVPSNPISYIHVGDAYLALGKEYDAIVYYKKALQVDSESAGANMALGNIYFKRNDLNSAEPYYKKVMQIAPKDSSAYCNLIYLYINNNKKSYAKSTLSSLLYRNPSAKSEECVKQLIPYLSK